MPPSPSGRSSLYGPIDWPGCGEKTAASTTDSERKSGRASSSASIRFSSAPSSGSASATASTRRATSGGSISRSSSSSADSVDQRCVSTAKRAGSALQRGQQEHSRLLPVAPHAALGPLEQAGDLGLGQAGEVTHLDDLREAGVEVVELVEGDVEAEHVLVEAHAAAGVLGQVGDAVQVAAALHREPLARVVDDDAAHRRRGVREEVRAVLELGL